MSNQATARRLLPEGMKVSHVAADSDALTIHAESADLCARCPDCARDSRRPHSRYQRRVADLPWRGIAVEIRIRARRFFCEEPSCERRIFCERLPDVAARARKTNRLGEGLLAIVLELGGRAGARLAAELGLLVGRDALLTRVKSVVHSENAEHLKIVGIDDFGFKRGNAAGTIMVDLERHEVVDLVRGHSTELIARWLKRHPNLEVVARDRSNVCREGIDAGAPEAQQIADRWHLLKNLTQIVEDFLLTKRPELKKAAMPEEPSEDGKEDHVPSGGVPDQRPDRVPFFVSLTMRAFVRILAAQKGQSSGPVELRARRTPTGSDTRALHAACSGCSALGSPLTVPAPPSD
jgi:transposase